jgi:septal ring factor EnvC (AmiA/AmiB activator)
MLNKYLKYCFFTLFLFTVFNQDLSAQRKNRRQLEIEKKRNLAKLAEAKRILEETRNRKETTVGKIKAIKEQISSQEEQISLMEEDLALIDMEMQEINQTNEHLQLKLEDLQKEYASMLYATSKMSGKINKLSFLFSANSFNDLVMRYKYLQQYTENRKSQVVQINRVSALLRERQENLSGKRNDKKRIISAKVVEAQNLEALRSRQTSMVSELTEKEKDLRSEIEASKKSVNRLDNLIANVVAREMARNNREREIRQDKEAKIAAKKIQNKANKPQIKVVEQTTIALGSSFGASRNRLPWPVQRGFISDRFGVKAHPVLNGVLINNNGVDIQTSPNAAIRNVYDGIVKDVTEIPGLNKVVAVQHGDYFTVYANLNRVFVLVGQKISAKETIGTAAESGGVPEINFQIWHNTERMNPEKWLISR